MRCLQCFKEIDENEDFCPYCGTDLDEKNDVFLLQRGSILNDRYIIGANIGSGGFGNVYKAFDTKLESVVAIKEYYPRNLVNRDLDNQNVIVVSARNRNEFEYGKQRLLQEARNIARFSSYKNIVNVFEYFEEHHTSYMVMEYLNGDPLDVLLEENEGVLDEEAVRMIGSSICDALAPLHKEGIIHRDISPDNIYMCSTQVITLFDFGSAEFPDGENELPKIVKQGYAPPEQYETDSKQGPWTDIYALGATLYRLLVGEKPMVSTDRKVEDLVKSPHEINENISLNQGWSGTYSVNGNVLQISPVNYNTKIEAGQSIADIGFIICGSQNLQVTN